MAAPSEPISIASVQKSIVGPELGSVVGPEEGSGDGPGVTVGFNVGSRVSTGGANPSGAFGFRQIDNSARAPVLSNETITSSTSGTSTITEMNPSSLTVRVLPVLVIVSCALPFVYDVTLTFPETLNNLTK